MKLITFGCSNSAKLFPELKTWSEVLRDSLELELVDLTLKGSSNNTILGRIIQNLDKIENEDIVIIQLTYFNRANWFSTKDREKFTNHYITDVKENQIGRAHV